jgi:hypothetical protein
MASLVTRSCVFQPTPQRAGTLGPAVSALAIDGAAGWNDGILTKNSSFRVNVGGVGVGLKSHNLMASFF